MSRNFSSGQFRGQQASIDVGSRFVPSSFDRGDRGCELSLPFRVLNRTRLRIAGGLLFEQRSIQDQQNKIRDQHDRRHPRYREY